MFVVAFPAVPVEESPFSRRAESKEFLEIDEAEFNSVSSMIRGRVKLEEVNRVRQPNTG